MQVSRFEFLKFGIMDIFALLRPIMTCFENINFFLSSGTMKHLSCQMSGFMNLVHPWLIVLFFCSYLTLFLPITVKPVISSHSKRRPKGGFQDQLWLNAGQKYCRMLQERILQYIRPSLTYHLSLRPLFCLFLSGRLKQTLLYNNFAMLINLKYTLWKPILQTIWTQGS